MEKQCYVPLTFIIEKKQDFYNKAQYYTKRDTEQETN